jgi:hypothetical protein
MHSIVELGGPLQRDATGGAIGGLSGTTSWPSGGARADVFAVDFNDG